MVACLAKINDAAIIVMKNATFRSASQLVQDTQLSRSVDRLLTRGLLYM